MLYRSCLSSTALMRVPVFPRRCSNWPLACAVSVAAKALNRPVRCQQSRNNDMIMGGACACMLLVLVSLRCLVDMFVDCCVCSPLPGLGCYRPLR